MVFVARTLLAVAALIMIGAAPPTNRVDYLMTPVVVAGALEAIDVTLRFSGDADGSTDIELPNHWAGSDRLYETIEQVMVEGGRLAPVSKPELRRIDHAPNAALTLRYRVGGVSPADPRVDYEKARPVLRPGWFYLHGEGVFATPAGRGDAPATFRWSAPPNGWRYASSLDGYRGPMVNDVAEAILIGGTDLRIARRLVGGKPVTIALRGGWSFSDEAFANALAKVIDASNAYWQAEPIPYFVPMIPLRGGETGALSFGGTGRTGGFALASTTNVGMSELIYLLAHEYGHRWLGGSLGPMSKPDSLEYWFTEGFTDFVADAVLVRSGLRDERTGVAALNELLLRYASSPARPTRNEELARLYWQDSDAQQMAYDRGNLLALTLDGEASVRAALIEMARTPERFAADATQASRFLTAFPALTAARRDAMLTGTPLVLAEDRFEPCGTLRWVEQSRYASGYTAEEEESVLRFATVDRASPAWAAGLRPGMQYVSRESFKNGDARVPIVMRIADASGERVLTWLPRGSDTVRFQELVLKPNAGAACRVRLGGL